jgi:hypothetical protein
MRVVIVFVIWFQEGILNHVCNCNKFTFTLIYETKIKYREWTDLTINVLISTDVFLFGVGRTEKPTNQKENWFHTICNYLHM